ncbi:conserved Plasmodium protein, unknown function [Plasmodium yoelii]|uniref:Uncharacterized protein n=3 Tax=Plasmodium yoelii TaxID=5861 RepID=A0AAE9WQ32_PLAYO|nr:conserved Plasmodium protein, unknown function [Plasmodium yoelii]EAA17620.1 hypothetical protein [Plasmodium yoelii yoelii]WBY57850.1 hypothetical protein Py17XNL_001002161 [Plasmodium yoelii yoelii]CDU84946.1 conserved Plasmodium protein, unknown function [Plasmodium yoelii]VTZ78842.1 conserved Plasmodium protein, unknown function [Plasmodium yoelii]|eukprot:XP_726055.1 conserved Plasmodium protein, unknown function [Plasmodium yoelii]
MQKIIDTYEIIGNIDEQKSISSNNVVNNDKTNFCDNDKETIKCIKQNELSGEKEKITTENIINNLKEVNNLDEGKNDKENPKKLESQKTVDVYKTFTNTAIHTSKTLSLENVKNENNNEKVNKYSDNKSEILDKKILITNDKSNKNNDQIIKKNGNFEIGKNESILEEELNNKTKGINNINNGYTNINKNDKKISHKKHYKILIHAPACWKGTNFNSTPYVLAYDKSSNFLIYNESPLEIEKYIIDENDKNFENKILTILFYDSLDACNNCSNIIKKNEEDCEKEEIPKPLSAFYLPICKIDLRNDSVKYRLALNTNNISSNININEAINLFNNSSKITGQNINKFSLHFILKNNNYTGNDPYTFLKQTKFYGVPRSNLSTYTAKYKPNDCVNNNITDKYQINSSKSQIIPLKPDNSEKKQFASLERLKNKWENFAINNNENLKDSLDGIKKINKPKTEEFKQGINGSQSLVGNVKSELLRKLNKEGIYEYNGKSTLNFDGKITSKDKTESIKKEEKENTFDSIRIKYENKINGSKMTNDVILNHTKNKSYYDLLSQNDDKSKINFDIKDDILPDDSASMIHVRQQRSIYSEKEKTNQSNYNNYDCNIHGDMDGESTLTNNFRTVNKIYSGVKEMLKKQNMNKKNDSIYKDSNNAKVENMENYCESSIYSKNDDNKTGNYIQLDNLKNFNTSNSVCLSNLKSEENLILAINEIKQWMEKIDDKMSTISYEKSELGIINNTKDTGNGNNTGKIVVNGICNGLQRGYSKDEKYNRMLKFLIKNVKKNIKLKKMSTYKGCYLNIRNLYLMKKNEKIKFENKLLKKDYDNLKSKYKNVLVKLCKKIFLLKYYTTKDRSNYDKKYENMMRHLQSEKNNLLNIIEEKKYEQENNININMMLSDELKKLQEENESIISNNNSYKTEVETINSKYQHLQNDFNKIKSEHEKLKIEHKNIKRENENIKIEKETLIKELGDTKAKYFNMTGILQGEEKMYAKKIKELEEKLQKEKEEKKNIINDVKDEIDTFTKILEKKENENHKIKEKLKELKNIEEKYENTQINFDSLKKEFEKSFDEVQIILKEMIQKEKEYTNSYNKSIRSLEKEHKHMIDKLLTEKNVAIEQINFYKNMCKNQCNKMIVFDESLKAVEQLLEHILSQYPHVLNEIGIKCRNNISNKSIGKIQYENIHAVKDNIKLIRKSLNHFKMNSKSTIHNFVGTNEHGKKYHTDNISGTVVRGCNGRSVSLRHNKTNRCGSISRNSSKKCSHNNNDLNCHKNQYALKSCYNGDDKIYENISNFEYKKNNDKAELLRKKNINDSNNARSASTFSQNAKKKNIDIKKKIDIYNTLLQKTNNFSKLSSNNAENTNNSDKEKTKFSTQHDKNNKYYHFVSKNNDKILDQIKQNQLSDMQMIDYSKGHENVKTHIKERQSQEYYEQGENIQCDLEDTYPDDRTINKESSYKLRVNGNGKREEYYKICSEENDLNNYGEDEICDGKSHKKEKSNLYCENNDTYDNMNNEITELNNFDIVNMYEHLNYSSNVNTPDSLPTNIFTESDVKKKEKDHIINGDYEVTNNNIDKIEKMKLNNSKNINKFDKNNFNEVISFIEKNVIKNCEIKTL